MNSEELEADLVGVEARPGVPGRLLYVEVREHAFLKVM